MLTTLALSLLAVPTTKAVDPHIVSASLFKNGFAVVSREFEVPNPGVYSIEKIPESSMGTLWFTASDGTKLESVTSTIVEKKSKSAIASIDGVLSANIGQQIRIGIKNKDEVSGGVQEGKLLAVGNDFVLLKSAIGSTMIPKGEIGSIACLTGQLLYQTEISTPNRVLIISTSGKPGRVHMISMEHGMTWSPAYAIDITNPKKLTIVGKATVMNDIEDLTGIEARFVTGFPNVPFSTYLDPLIRGGTVRDFTSMLESIGNPNAVTVFGGRSGGFGGQGNMLSQNSSAPPLRDFEASMNVSPLAGTQQEDLFFYKQPFVTAKRGDRSYHILFSAEALYEDVYTWDLADSTTNNIEYRGLPDVPEDVWHTLQFKNTSGQPFTTAVATTFKNGEILGQDTMHYVTKGATAEVKITKALDVHAEADESELSRERGAIKNPGNYPIFDLVSLKGTLRVTNTKSKTIKLRIKKDLTGDIGEVSGNPTITKTAKGLRSMNPGGKIEWNTEVEPGKSLTLTYAYKLYVRSQQ